jgi:heme/copper-type cytochrome/quinol oxidase subunit 2
MKSSLALSVLAFLSAPVFVPRSAAQSASNSEAVQVITVTAKKYEFDPSPIRVKQGTKVRLNITASDHAHGFKIGPFAEGAEKGDPGLVFSSPLDCTKIEKGHRPQWNS